MLEGKIVIEPHLPAEITDIETSVKIGDGTLYYKYRNGKLDVRYEGGKVELEIHEPTGQQYSPVFEGITFCTPDPLDSYPCFAVYHDPALTY